MQFLNNPYGTLQEHTWAASSCNLLNSEGKFCSKDWICILLNAFHQELSELLHAARWGFGPRWVEVNGIGGRDWTANAEIL